jgi:phage terminase large subunit-like protein
VWFECAAEQKRSEILNQKMRKLVQRLGEAIHASVSESEYIAGVVQDIRKQGFDVLLMLEATIGLNEVAEQQPAAAKKSSKAAGAEGPEEDSTFTVQDLHFLKSLRIAVEGEEDILPDE